MLFFALIIVLAHAGWFAIQFPFDITYLLFNLAFAFQFTHMARPIGVRSLQMVFSRSNCVV
jgi:hypothetical protein